jgi:hypothetical protein
MNKLRVCKALGSSISTRASKIYIALVVSGLRQNDQTLDWLEKAYQDRSNGLIFSKLDPELDSLRSNPRFQSLQPRVALLL